MRGLRSGLPGGMQRSDDAFAARIALFYGALFLIYGTHVPFTPVWLSWRGLSAAEISAVMSVPLFLRVFVTPAVALSADRSARHRQAMQVLAWLSLATATTLAAAASGFWTILALVAMLVICNATLMPLAETMAVKGVRDRGLDYGRVRLWGSLTFIVASFLGGLAVTRWGGGAGMWLVVCGCAATVAAAYLLPRIPAEPVLDVSQRRPLWHAEEPRRLLRSKPFLAFLAAAGGTQAAHATLMTYGVLLWRDQGLSATAAGALWAIAVLAEVALFAWSARLVSLLGPARLLALAAASSIIRWIAMAFDPPLVLLVPLQMLHALTYGGSHVAAIHFIHQAVPPPIQGSAQALYATIASGLAMGLATLTAGSLYAAYGGLSYLAMAALASLALAGALTLGRLWQGDGPICDTPAEPAAAA